MKTFTEINNKGEILAAVVTGSAPQVLIAIDGIKAVSDVISGAHLRGGRGARPLLNFILWHASK